MTTAKGVLAALALTVTAAAAGCLDAVAPGGPPRLASFSVVPVFSAGGSLDGIPTDVDSIVVTIHNPPAPDIVVAQRIVPGQDSIILVIEVPLGSAAVDTVGITFQAIRSSDGAVLYQGAQELAVRVGQPTRADTVRAVYVGPGQNIERLTVSPRSVAPAPGVSADLVATATDSGGATIIGMPVLWTSRNAGVASVSQTGTVLGVGEGTTWVLAISGARSSVRDSASVVVSRTPVAVIGFTPPTVSFAGTAGGANPASQDVAVANVGSGPLGGLAVSGIAYASGQPTGWLTATLGGSSAPATLTLQAATGTLPAGTYGATVSVTSAQASNSPALLPVTFVVGIGPLIGFSTASVTLVDTAGTSDPAPRTVTVGNAGGGDLTGLDVGTITYGPSQPTGWLSASLSAASAPSVLTLTVTKGSLPAGAYTAVVPVTSPAAANSPQVVTVTLDVRAQPLAAIVATPGYRVAVPADTFTVQVAGRDGSGNPVSVSGVTFASRSTGVATVNPTTGFVTAVGPGTAVLVATTPVAGIADSLLLVVPESGQAVAIPLASGRAFGAARAGDTVRVQVTVDLRRVSGEVLGSYNAQLDWASGIVSYVATDAAGFPAPTVNDVNAATGQLRFGAANAGGTPGPSIVVAEIRYVAQAAGSTALTFALTDLSAALTFTNLLPGAAVLPGSVRVQ